MKDEIDEIKKESGIDEMELDCVELKRAVTAFMVENSLDRLNFKKGFHGTLVRATYGATWIGERSQLTDDAPGYAVPLKELLTKKFKRSPDKAKKMWLRLTTRIPDPIKIEEAIAEGVITVQDVAPAWWEKDKSPYLRIFSSDD
jgi:hypothetical protein